MIGLPVTTRSNAHIGHVGNIRIDSDSQTIVQYCVCTKKLLHRWTKCRDDCLIHVRQVIRIEPTHMIVEDLVENNEERIQEQVPLTVAPAQSTIIRQARYR